jgi:hypothetical protein
MFPLPIKNTEVPIAGKMGSISILVLNTKSTAQCRPIFASCGTPDSAIVRLVTTNVAGREYVVGYLTTYCWLSYHILLHRSSFSVRAAQIPGKREWVVSIISPKNDISD